MDILSNLSALEKYLKSKDLNVKNSLNNIESCIRIGILTNDDFMYKEREVEITHINKTIMKNNELNYDFDNFPPDKYEESRSLEHIFSNIQF